MNLAKTDKLIAIIGVIIIIVAAIAIVVYTQTYDEDEDDVLSEPKEKTFNLTWEHETEEITSIEDVAKKTYEHTIDVDATHSGKICVLTSVDIEVCWEDDNVYGLLKNKGLDKLTAEIKKSDESTYESKDSTGSGNMTFSFTGINSKPMAETIEAETESEAIDYIKDMYDGKDSESFDVMITVQTGEKRIRPLQFLKDRGNDFEIKISYTYYYYELEEVEDNDDDDKPSDYVPSGFLAEYWNNVFKGSNWV